MKRRLRSSVSKGAFEFLPTDLNTALTFMNVAESTGKADVRERNYKNARRAYDSVMRLMQNKTIDDTQREELNQRLAVLKSRLQNVGQQF
jgi:glycogen debranching enzyme